MSSPARSITRAAQSAKKSRKITPRTQKRNPKGAEVIPAPFGKRIKATAVRLRKIGRQIVMDLWK